MNVDVKNDTATSCLLLELKNHVKDVTVRVITQEQYDCVYEYVLHYDQVECREEQYWEYHHCIKTRDASLIHAFQQLYPNGICGSKDLWIEVVEKSKQNKQQNEEYARISAEREALQSQGKQCRVYSVTRVQNDDDENGFASEYNMEEFIQRMGCTEEQDLITLQQLRDGDIVDVEGYRGTGLWLYMNQCLIRSTGWYGYFLPEEGFIKVLEHGLQYYENTGAQYICIPATCKICKVSHFKKEDKNRIKYSNIIDNIGQYALSLDTHEKQKYEIEMDGQRFDAEFVQHY